MTRRILLSLLVVLAFLAGAAAHYWWARPACVPALASFAPAANLKSTLTLATYNVRNFFDQYDNPYTADELTPPKKPEELAHLARAIRALDADVLVLQEVEAGGVIKTFARDYLPEMRYRFVVDSSTEDPRGITIVALSRLPVLRIVSHRLAPLAGGHRLARDLLRLDIQARPGHVLYVYAVHFKSKRTDPDGRDHQSQRWRRAEAAAARDFIREELGPNPAYARFAILGDCNDTIDAEPVQTLRATTAPRMIDALGHLPPPQRITFHGETSEGIDHILLSPQLAAEVVPGSAEILTGGSFEKASDHRPVRVKLRVP